MEMSIPRELMAQRFCNNDECHVLSWDPSMTLTELATDMQVVDLPDISGDQKEIK